MSKLKIDLHALPDKLSVVFHQVSRFRRLIFLVVLAIVYGFVVLRISALDNAQPSSSVISAQSNPVTVPHIDQASVNQLEKLQNNSVSVQALFDQARNNPFQ